MCTAKCPVVAISGTFNYLEVKEAHEAKKAAREKAKADKAKEEAAKA